MLYWRQNTNITYLRHEIISISTSEPSSHCRCTYTFWTVVKDPNNTGLLRPLRPPGRTQIAAMPSGDLHGAAVGDAGLAIQDMQTLAWSTSKTEVATGSHWTACEDGFVTPAVEPPRSPGRRFGQLRWQGALNNET